MHHRVDLWSQCLKCSDRLRLNYVQIWDGNFSAPGSLRLINKLESNVFTLAVGEVFSAAVAEGEAAPAVETVASAVLFDPKPALRTLLELHAVDEGEEFLIILALVVKKICLAAEALVPLRLAIKAILVQALGAVESMFTFFVVEYECIGAIGRGTPADVRLDVCCL